MILCDDGLYQSWQNNGVANVLLEFWVQLYFFLSVAFKVMIFHINESNMIKKEFSKHFSCFKAALAFWYWPKSATASRLFLNLCYILWSYTNVMRQVLLQPKYYFFEQQTFMWLYHDISQNVLLSSVYQFISFWFLVIEFIPTRILKARKETMRRRKMTLTMTHRKTRPPRVSSRQSVSSSDLLAECRVFFLWR